MKEGLLMAGTILIAIVSGANISMIWDGNGIGIWISGLLSAVATVLPLLMFIIIYKNPWVLVTKFISLITFSTPLILSEYQKYTIPDIELELLLLNGITMILCLISLSLLISKSFTFRRLD